MTTLRDTVIQAVQGKLASQFHEDYALYPLDQVNTTAAIKAACTALREAQQRIEARYDELGYEYAVSVTKHMLAECLTELEPGQETTE